MHQVHLSQMFQIYLLFFLADDCLMNNPISCWHYLYCNYKQFISHQDITYIKALPKITEKRCLYIKVDKNGVLICYSLNDFFFR